MGGFKASSVSEELVTGAQREAGEDFVYGETKPPAEVRSFARLVSTAFLPNALFKLEVPVNWVNI